jgi:hypothetical protein
MKATRRDACERPVGVATASSWPRQILAAPGFCCVWCFTHIAALSGLRVPPTESRNAIHVCKHSGTQFTSNTPYIGGTWGTAAPGCVRNALRRVWRCPAELSRPPVELSTRARLYLAVMFFVKVCIVPLLVVHLDLSPLSADQTISQLHLFFCLFATHALPFGSSEFLQTHLDASARVADGDGVWQSICCIALVHRST